MNYGSRKRAHCRSSSPPPGPSRGRFWRSRILQFSESWCRLLGQVGAPPHVTCSPSAAGGSCAAVVYWWTTWERRRRWKEQRTALPGVPREANVALRDYFHCSLCHRRLGSSGIRPYSFLSHHIRWCGDGCGCGCDRRRCSGPTCRCR